MHWIVNLPGFNSTAGDTWDWKLVDVSGVLVPGPASNPGFTSQTGIVISTRAWTNHMSALELPPGDYSIMIQYNPQGIVSLTNSCVYYINFNIPCGGTVTPTETPTSPSDDSSIATFTGGVQIIRNVELG